VDIGDAVSGAADPAGAAGTATGMGAAPSIIAPAGRR
jgi:hypothetical protein